MKTNTTSTHLIPIEHIQQAKLVLEDVIHETPLSKNKYLSKKFDANVYLKREDLQVVRSFKIRGAYFKMAKLSESERKKGIVCASAGNHAQGVALACSILGIKGTIFMPTTTPKQKMDRVELFGEEWVNVILVGDTFDDSNARAMEYSVDQEMPFIHPYNDLDVIAGQATVGLEILEDSRVPVDYLLVSVGGGGLISGVGSYFKLVSPRTAIVAIEGEGAPSLYEALKQGQVVTLDRIDSFADGIATKKVGDLTLEMCKSIVDKHLLVPEGKMCATILEMYNTEAIVLEPAGACVISALDYLKDEIRGKNVVCVLSGGNNDITRMEEIKERALLWEGKKHYFIVQFPQRSGALNEFLSLLGPNDDITRFEYTKKNNRESGPALIGIEFKDPGDFVPLIQRMDDAHISYEHLNKSRILFDMLV